ncbi:hypothetical protein ACN6KF_004332 [Labrys sp. La1]|uniref:hypothetical protein n=1 Tax=Labrys sp. La1 TaxID=3404917 RepID=UPI003EBBA8C8
MAIILTLQVGIKGNRHSMASLARISDLAQGMEPNHRQREQQAFFRSPYVAKTTIKVEYLT